MKQNTFRPNSLLALVLFINFACAFMVYSYPTKIQSTINFASIPPITSTGGEITHNGFKKKQNILDVLFNFDSQVIAAVEGEEFNAITENQLLSGFKSSTLVGFSVSGTINNLSNTTGLTVKVATTGSSMETYM